MCRYGAAVLSTATWAGRGRDAHVIACLLDDRIGPNTWSFWMCLHLPTPNRATPARSAATSASVHFCFIALRAAPPRGFLFLLRLCTQQERTQQVGEWASSRPAGADVMQRHGSAWDVITD